MSILSKIANIKAKRTPKSNLFMVGSFLFIILGLLIINVLVVSVISNAGYNNPSLFDAEKYVIQSKEYVKEMSHGSIMTLKDGIKTSFICDGYKVTTYFDKDGNFIKHTVLNMTCVKASVIFWIVILSSYLTILLDSALEYFNSKKHPAMAFYDAYSNLSIMNEEIARPSFLSSSNYISNDNALESEIRPISQMESYINSFEKKEEKKESSIKKIIEPIVYDVTPSFAPASSVKQNKLGNAIKEKFKKKEDLDDIYSIDLSSLYSKPIDPVALNNTKDISINLVTTANKPVDKTNGNDLNSNKTIFTPYNYNQH
ncbi:MAG: hypothetical protein MJ245_02450 [Clostridia bacterium]|nr:hypothetical protein [Clostridia bacterium]